MDQVNEVKGRRQVRFPMPKMEGVVARWYARQRGSASQMAAYRNHAAQLTDGAQLAALLAVFVWAMPSSSSWRGWPPPEAGRLLPVLAATTLGGANSTASMPPIPPDLQPPAPAATAALLAGLAAPLGTVAARTTIHHDTTRTQTPAGTRSERYRTLGPLQAAAVLASLGHWLRWVTSRP